MMSYTLGQEMSRDPENVGSESAMWMRHEYHGFKQTKFYSLSNFMRELNMQDTLQVQSRALVKERELKAFTTAK